MGSTLACIFLGKEYWPEVRINRLSWLVDQGPGKRNYLETKRYIKQMYKRTHMGVLSVKLFLMLLSMRDCRADTRIQVGQGDLRNKCPRNSDFRLDYKSTVIKIV